MATLPHDVSEQSFEEYPPTGLEQPIHETLGPCGSLLQEYRDIEHAWKVANWVYKTRATFGDSKAKRKLFKKQTSGILYLALYLIWSISSDKLDALEKTMKDSPVLEHTSSSNANLCSQVRLLPPDDGPDHHAETQHDRETAKSTQGGPSSTHMADAGESTDNSTRRDLLVRKCNRLGHALVEAARRMKWILLHEPDYIYARRSYEHPQMLYMTYDSCREAMEYIREDEERSGKFALKYRVADLEAIKDWWALLQLGRKEFNDFQGNEGKIAKGKDECDIQMAQLQQRIDRAHSKPR